MEIIRIQFLIVTLGCDFFIFYSTNSLLFHQAEISNTLSFSENNKHFLFQFYKFQEDDVDLPFIFELSSTISSLE